MSAITPDDQERIDAIEQALLKRWPETRIAPTLERISALVDALGSPQLTYPTIHVGGTNGKTTTARMIDSLLFAMGLRTGRFTSPHLESYLDPFADRAEFDLLVVGRSDDHSLDVDTRQVDRVGFE